MTDELLAIRAGRLVDSVAGEVLEDRTLVVRNGRIETILPLATTAPENARASRLAGRDDGRAA